MKRFWFVLLSLGLIMAFSVSAYAVDVKVGAEYYVGGIYVDKTDVVTDDDDVSTAFFYQRLRVGTDFIVSPSLKLVTRFDAMERVWGGPRSNTWLVNRVMPEYSAGTRFESENIAFDNVYIDYTSPIGLFQVGYMPDSTWGTVFGNDSTNANRGMIKWAAPIKNTGFVVLANYVKIEDNSYTAVSSQSYDWYTRLMGTRTDRDYNGYRVGTIYNFKSDKANGQAGILGIFTRDASNRGMIAGPYKTTLYTLIPYFKANIGPVALQGEFNYTFGDAIKFEYDMAPYGWNKATADSMSAFLDANANFGMVSVGGTFAYVQGDDNPSDDKVHNINTGGVDWNPCLILFNSDTIYYWVGGIAGNGGTAIGGPMTNAWLFQGRVGVKPTAQLDALLSVTYATADKKPSSSYKKDYGWEIDLTGTYKITNNLSYMLGIGYLFTGDYFKGGDSAAQLDDDFIILNKLTLSF